MSKIKILIVTALMLMVPSISSAAWWFTTDDGKRDFNLELAEVFERHGAKFTLFINSGNIGRPGFLTADEVRDLDRRGFPIGSHCLSHAFPLIPREAFSIRMTWVTERWLPRMISLSPSDNGMVVISDGRESFAVMASTVAELVERLNEAFTAFGMHFSAKIYDPGTALFPLDYITDWSPHLVTPGTPAQWEFEHGWSTDQIAEIVREDKSRMEAVLGHSVTRFSFPFGVGTVTAQNIVRDVGYISARILQDCPTKVRWSDGSNLYSNSGLGGSWFVVGSNQSSNPFAVPVTIQVRDRLYRAARTTVDTPEGRIALREVLRQIVDEAPENVVMLDHNGDIPVWVYDELLSILNE